MLNSVGERKPPCCVGFASLDVVYDKLSDCVWNVCL